MTIESVEITAPPAKREELLRALTGQREARPEWIRVL